MPKKLDIAAELKGPSKGGRPRKIQHPRQISVRLDEDLYKWLLKKSAELTLETGKRHDMASLVRAILEKEKQRQP